ncbi:cupin [Nocardiopsis baichengensis]|uniref:cupin n=1 Tax=Nocardiopsis baichengensis TaxID=280240 RepID=UPI001EF9DD3B|nr:cupin [Nocardiopsis baichengensis]
MSERPETERSSTVKFDPESVAAYSAADVSLWSWTDEDEGTHVGYIADEHEKAAMGMAFVHFRSGVEFDFTWPYDEVCIVTRGSLTVDTLGRRITARAGQVMTQPKGVPGTFRIGEDLEMICVHHPTFARANGMSLQEYKAATDAGEHPSLPVAAARRAQSAGGFFDPAVMQVFDISDIPDWITVDGEQGAKVGYIADKAEGAPFGLAFSDFRRGGVYELEFPYDEVAAITSGSFTVRSNGRSFKASAGQMLYMPHGVSAVFEIDEDTVAVGLHHPTFEDAMGHPPHEG